MQRIAAVHQRDRAFAIMREKRTAPLQPRCSRHQQTRSSDGLATVGRNGLTRDQGVLSPKRHNSHCRQSHSRVPECAATCTGLYFVSFFLFSLGEFLKRSTSCRRRHGRNVRAWCLDWTGSKPRCTRDSKSMAARVPPDWAYKCEAGDLHLQSTHRQVLLGPMPVQSSFSIQPVCA